MGLYNWIRLEGRRCPGCGNPMTAVVTHKWGLLELREQRIGDHILWDANGEPSPILYVDPIPKHRSWLLREFADSCGDCTSKDVAVHISPAWPAIIEIRNDLIREVYWVTIPMEKAVLLVNGVLDGSLRMMFGAKEDSTAGALAALLHFHFPLIDEYERRVMDPTATGRELLIEAWEIIASVGKEILSETVRAEQLNRLKARIGRCFRALHPEALRRIHATVDAAMRVAEPTAQARLTKLSATLSALEKHVGGALESSAEDELPAKSVLWTPGQPPIGRNPNQEW